MTFAKPFLLVFLLLNGLVWFAFQKRYLPKWLSKIVSRVYFWPTFPITALLRTGNYWTQIDDTIVLGCAPMSFMGHPQALHNIHVRGVVNMCSEYAGPEAAYKELRMKQLRLPSVDHYEPDLQYMKDAVQFIEDCKSKNEKVYIHCKAGHGRAASIALCWLMHTNRDRSAEDLNKLLFSKRKVRSTLFQQANVKAYYKYIQDQK